MLHVGVCVPTCFECSNAMYVAYLAKVVLRGIPHHGRAGVDTCPVLLHDDARDDVLEGLVERLELLETVINDRIRPVRHLFAKFFGT